jgi:hypothetical protein
LGEIEILEDLVRDVTIRLLAGFRRLEQSYLRERLE